MNSSKPKKLSRREFAQRAAVFSVAGPLVPSNLTLAEHPTTPTPAPQTNEPKLSPEGQKESDARYQSILSTFGDRLSDPEKTTVRTLCVFLQPSLEHVRAFHLDNGDNPALYLKPLLEREKKPQPLPKSPAGKKS